MFDLRAKLPSPSGPHAVGFFDGQFQYRCGEKERSVGYRCYYPAKKSEAVPAMYFDKKEMARMQAAIPTFTALEPVLRSLCELPTHSVRNAEAAEAGGKLPVLLYSHGYTAYAWSNLVQLEELASHGYAIFCLSHAGDAAFTQLEGGQMLPMDLERWQRSCGEEMAFVRSAGTSDPKSLSGEQVRRYLGSCTVLGEQIQVWRDDTLAAMDEITRLAGKGGLPFQAECSTMGLFGHSLGGAASLLTASQDKRVAGAVNFDGWQYGPSLQGRPLGTPALVLSAGENHLAASYCPTDRDITFALVRGSAHLSFCDLYTLFPQAVQTASPEAVIDSEKMAALLSACVLRFFDQNLRNVGKGGLEELLRSYGSDVIYWRNEEAAD